MLDIKTIILISVGILTIATMIYCIVRESAPPKQSKSDIEIVDDHSESNYDTMDEESVYESM